MAPTVTDNNVCVRPGVVGMTVRIKLDGRVETRRSTLTALGIGIVVAGGGET
jgi:hypothetical protein